MLRKLSGNTPNVPTVGIKRFTPEELKTKFQNAGNVKGPDPNEEPKTIDPLTGKMITATENQQKYGDGTKLIYVKIDGQNGGMGRITRMTVKAYQQQFYNDTKPPKATETLKELLGIDNSTMKNEPDGKWRAE